MPQQRRSPFRPPRVAEPARREGYAAYACTAAKCRRSRCYPRRLQRVQRKASRQPYGAPACRTTAQFRRPPSRRAVLPAATACPPLACARRRPAARSRRSGTTPSRAQVCSRNPVPRQNCRRHAIPAQKPVRVQARRKAGRPNLLHRSWRWQRQRDGQRREVEAEDGDEEDTDHTRHVLPSAVASTLTQSRFRRAVTP